MEDANCSDDVWAMKCLADKMYSAKLGITKLILVDTVTALPVKKPASLL
jgi:hypothetical protein